MEIEFSDHVVEQIKRRGISKKKVLETVDNPDREMLSSRGRRLLQKKFGDKVLEVVSVWEKGRLIIVTAYYLHEVELRSKS